VPVIIEEGETNSPELPDIDELPSPAVSDGDDNYSGGLDASPPSSPIPAASDDEAETLHVETDESPFVTADENSSSSNSTHEAATVPTDEGRPTEIPGAPVTLPGRNAGVGVEDRQAAALQRHVGMPQVERHPLAVPDRPAPVDLGENQARLHPPKPDGRQTRLNQVAVMQALAGRAGPPPEPPQQPPPPQQPADETAAAPAAATPASGWRNPLQLVRGAIATGAANFAANAKNELNVVAAGSRATVANTRAAAAAARRAGQQITRNVDATLAHDLDALGLRRHTRSRGPVPDEPLMFKEPSKKPPKKS